jgi:tRNA/rRNA methyltransferase
LVNIPTVDFTSLNLAQAVMVVCYSLSTAAQTNPPAFTPRLAKCIELDQMYDELTVALVRIGYMNPQNPAYWMNRIRRFFARLRLRSGEASIIRGICRQIHWYGDKRYADGFKDGGKA